MHPKSTLYIYSTPPSQPLPAESPIPHRAAAAAAGRAGQDHVLGPATRRSHGRAAAAELPTLGQGEEAGAGEGEEAGVGEGTGGLGEQGDRRTRE